MHEAKNKRVSHFFLRLPDRTPVGVVAMLALDDELVVSVSLCAKQDRWDRKYGVNVARGQLFATDGRVALVSYDNCGHLTLRDVFDILEIPAKRRGVDMLHAEALFDKQIDYLARRFHKKSCLTLISSDSSAEPSRPSS